MVNRTTTSLTATWSASLSALFGFHEPSKVFEYLVRGTFFALNLTFDAVMWGLFTRALTLASSTVHVSVLNTSANFLVTAAAGALVFTESLPPLWWVGATLLILGAWVIGRREKGREESGTGKVVKRDGPNNGVDGDGADAVSLGLLDEQREEEDEDPDAPIAEAGTKARRDASRYEDDPVLIDSSEGTKD